jgi:uncharacterized protein YbjT (DUF2867 family)
LGRQIIGAAAGVDLRVLARNPARLTGLGVAAVKGDVLDPASMRAAMVGVDTVVSALGTPLMLKGPVTLLSEGTRNIVAAMRATGVARLLCVTGMGAGDSRGHGGFLYDRVILPLLLGRIYADKDRQEAVVRQSGLDWTLIRPAMLKDGPGRGAWREITHWQGAARMTAIDRADVAAFVVAELLAPRHSGQTVNLSW